MRNEFGAISKVQGRSASSGEGGITRIDNEYLTPPADWGEFVFPLLDGHGAVWVRNFALSTSGVPQVITAGLVNADNVSPTGIIGEDIRGFLFGFDGANFDRVRTISPANVAASPKIGVLAVSNPPGWTAQAQPAANVAAVATRAAQGAGTRNIVQSLTITLIAASASSTVLATLGDGVTVFWSAKLLALTGDSKSIVVSGLNIPMGDNLPAILTVAAGGVNTEATAALSGYTV